MIPLDPDALLGRKETAAALTKAGFKVSAETLTTKASRGGGPPYQLFGPREGLRLEMHARRPDFVRRRVALVVSPGQQAVREWAERYDYTATLQREGQKIVFRLPIHQAV